MLDNLGREKLHHKPEAVLQAAVRSCAWTEMKQQGLTIGDMLTASSKTAIEATKRSSKRSSDFKVTKGTFAAFDSDDDDTPQGPVITTSELVDGVPDVPKQVVSAVADWIQTKYDVDPHNCQSKCTTVKLTPKANAAPKTWQGLVNSVRPMCHTVVKIKGIRLASTFVAKGMLVAKDEKHFTINGSPSSAAAVVVVPVPLGLLGHVIGKRGKQLKTLCGKYPQANLQVQEGAGIRAMCPATQMPSLKEDLLQLVALASGCVEGRPTESVAVASCQCRDIWLDRSSESAARTCELLLLSSLAFTCSSRAAEAPALCALQRRCLLRWLLC